MIQNSQHSIEREQVGGLTPHIFNTYYKATIIEIMVMFPQLYKLTRVNLIIYFK